MIHRGAVLASVNSLNKNTEVSEYDIVSGVDVCSQVWLNE